MAAASKTKRNPWVDPWGDDAVERTESNALDWKQQLQALSPTSFLNEMMGIQESNHAPHKEHRKPVKSETVFTRQVHEQALMQQNELKRETTAILEELKKQVKMLERAEHNLTSEIAKIPIEQMPAKAGIYYLRYFEWLISVVRQLRMKVEEGASWMQQFNGRKKKKGYWNMYKKHGTTFGLSNERSLATQTG